MSEALTVQSSLFSVPRAVQIPEKVHQHFYEKSSGDTGVGIT